MEFLDEFESKPRFVLQSRQVPHPSDSDQQSNNSRFASLHKPTLIICIPISILIFFVTFFYFNDIEPIKSILLWLGISLFVGPFAPSSLTGGDISVGVGPPIKDVLEEENVVETKEKYSRKSARKQVNQPESVPRSDFDDGVVGKSVSGSRVNGKSELGKVGEEKKLNVEEGEWNDADEELLRKLMVKNPVGKPGRWEVIAEGFKGKYKVESVISRSKELGVRKVSDQDSYKKFLKDRKPVDDRVEDEINAIKNGEDGKESEWTAGEDLALLNALKTFPKEVAMRWEKIAAAIPGKTKNACMKRVGELKKDFRSTKSSSGQAS